MLSCNINLLVSILGNGIYVENSLVFYLLFLFSFLYLIVGHGHDIGCEIMSWMFDKERNN